MKFTLFLYSVMAFSLMLPLGAKAGMDKSELLIADLNTAHGIQVSRISGRDSYNNQPYVTKEGVYFTHEVINEQGESQTDIVFYDFKTQQTTNFSNSEVSEYSPTLIPNGDKLSAIVVEADGKQKLWHYPLKSTQAPKRIFEWIEPVGYHAWGADNDLVMFILGDPHTLQYTTIAAAQPKVVAENIGRSLVFAAKKRQFIFSYYRDNQHWLASFSAQSSQTQDLFRLPGNVQYFALKDDNTLIYALGQRIYQRKLSEPKAVSLWLDLSRYCDTTISRLSYAKQKLAFVCDK
ncbi:hypothetical protein [Pseudoalteromonas mariniglutinosa]|uniref:hypothetical protein n=1 Tax=Pseudoalteromonas mariniglutinosa TaxID=206042 RepID=UPI003851497C